MNINGVLLRRSFAVAVMLGVLAMLFTPLTNSNPSINAQDGTTVPNDEDSTGPIGTDGANQFNDDEIVNVMVVFDRPAAVELDNDLSGEAVGQAETGNAVLSQNIEQMGFEIAYRHTTLINAVQVTTTRGDIDRLAGLPGVAYVEEIPILVGHHSNSIPHISADDWWQATGSAGQGVTVSVIDTGVNYEHNNFGACTLNRGVPGVLADEEDPINIGNGFGDETYNGVNCKVLAGIDFYSGDDNPQDCNPDTTLTPGLADAVGHGTHVAGSAVGYGILNVTGATYTGPYNATTVNGNFFIYPGVAPQANLIIARVLGCNFSTGGSFVPDPVTAAIEWSVAQNADVINMSLGSEWNTTFYETVIQNATLAGTIVVASSGNSGDAHYVTGSPASASYAISVAASFDNSDVLGSFSSRGPRRAQSNYDVVVKPDIAAPGVNIESSVAGNTNNSSATAERPGGEPTGLVSPLVYDGYPPFNPTSRATYPGTSMASPHIAGVAALLVDQYGTSFTAVEYKALLMNNTVNVTTTTNIGAEEWGPSRVGAGRIDMSKLLQNLTLEALAYNTTNPELVSVSFGQVEAVSGIYTDTRSITVENTTGASRQFFLSYDPATDMPGVNFETTASSVTVPANSTATITVRITVDTAVLAANLPNSQDPASVEANEDTFTWLTEEGGYITLTPVIGSALRVPVYALVRLGADISATDTIFLPGGNTGNSSVTLAGTGINTGNNLPNDVQSFVTPMELVATDPQGDLNFSTPYPVNFVDIEAIGVTQTTDKIYIGVNSYGDYTIPEEAQYFIYLDICQDGTYEWIVFNDEDPTAGEEDRKIFAYVDVLGERVAANTATTVGGDDELLNDINPNSATSYLMNNDTYIFPLPIAEFDVFTGGNCDNGQFNFYVESRPSLNFGGVFDSVGSSGAPLTYDYGNPTYDFQPNVFGNPADPFAFTDMPIWPAQDGASVPFFYDVTGLGDTFPDILLIHHHNANNTAEIVDVQRGSSLPVLSNSFVIGDWTTTADTDLIGASSGSYECTTSDNSEFAFRFTGNELTIQHIEQPGGGSYAVEIDGTILRTPDTAAGSVSLGTEAFTGLGAGYHVGKILPITAAPVCIDDILAFADPGQLPPDQNWFTTTTGTDTGTTAPSNRGCAVNRGFVNVLLALDGNSANYEFSFLFLSDDEIRFSGVLTVPGGFAVNLPIQVYYHNFVHTAIPGYSEVGNGSVLNINDTEVVVQLRDASGNCDSITVDYACQSGVSTITQNTSICIFQ